MGAEFDSTSQLVYGVRLYAASLYFAVKASFELGDSFHAIRLIRLRKSSGTLEAKGGSVERVPVEVWDIVQRKVKELASQLMKEEETAVLVGSMCPDCTDSMVGKTHELPSWLKYRSLQGGGKWGYCGCSELRHAAMRTIFRMNLTPFLEKYGLATKAWRNRLSRRFDEVEDSDAVEDSDYGYPPDDDGESEDEEEPDPEMEVLLVPCYDPYFPPPAAVVDRVEYGRATRDVFAFSLKNGRLS